MSKNNKRLSDTEKRDNLLKIIHDLAKPNKDEMTQKEKEKNLLKSIRDVGTSSESK